jgi:hypothetical protein
MGDRKIQEAVRQLAGTQFSDDVSLVACTVDSVDLETRTCDCTPIGGNASTEISGIQLMAEVDDGFLLEPAIGSTVIVCYSKRNVAHIAMYSELSKVTLVATNKIQLQGGEFGGLVKVIELTAKINRLENDINTLKAAFSSWVTVPSDGGAALKVISAAWAANTIQVTAKAEIENTSVIHGE